MKTLLKTLGIVVIATIIGFSMTACGGDPGGGGGEEGGGDGDTEIDGGFLTEGIWKDGEITASGNIIVYKVNVSLATSYNFWWNELSPNGNGDKTLDVSVTVTYNDGSAVTPAINAVDSAWSSSKTFVSTKSDTIKIKVSSKNAGGTGTFGIVYKTGIGSSRPSTLNFPPDATTLTPGEWASGEFTSSVTEIWYTFTATSAYSTTYNFWWNDSKAGNGSATADVQVSIWAGNETVQLANEDSAWRACKSYSASLSFAAPTYYVRVTPQNPGGTGTFNIVFTTSSASNRPWLTPVVTTPLNVGEWKNDSIAVDSIGEIWYSFTSTGGTRYVWWNDSKEGNGSATLDVEVAAYSSTGSSLISYSYDSGWRDYSSFSTTADATYYIRVMSRTEGDTGTFDLIFTSTSTWPWLAPTVTTPLTAGVWKDDEITADTNSEKWYTFTADTGTYRIWVNEGGSYVYYGDGTKTLDVETSGWKTGGTSLFTNVDSRWSSSQDITTLASGDIVYIRVRPYSSGNTGTYGIVYTKDNAERPLTFPLPTTVTALADGVWTDGSITSGTEAWYSITLSDRGYYNLWWNDSAQGNGSKTLDVVIGAWFENGDRAFEYNRVDGGWTSRNYYNYSSGATAHTTMYIKVSPNIVGETGTFAIAYHFGDSYERPWQVPINPTPLTAGQWTDGSIEYDGEVWFMFTAATATSYSFWKNGHYEDGTKDANINITPYTEDGTPTTYSSSSLDGWETPYPFTVSSAGTVYVKVTVNQSRRYAGTFAIAFTTNTTRPATSIVFPADGSLTLLTVGTWTDGEFTGSDSELWYKLTSTNYEVHRFWWNDKGQGDGNKTLDVNVSAWDDTGKILFVGSTATTPAMNLDSGWTTYGISASVNTGRSIYIRVTPKTAGETGTFGITCNRGSSSTRPEVPTTP